MPDYRGYVSPNNICGKLKFFVTRSIKPDLSEHQRIGDNFTFALHTQTENGARINKKARN